jgi:hypothetical protein
VVLLRSGTAYGRRYLHYKDSDLVIISPKAVPVVQVSYWVHRGRSKDEAIVEVVDTVESQVWMRQRTFVTRCSGTLGRKAVQQRSAQPIRRRR